MSLISKRNSSFARRVLFGFLLVSITLFFAWTRLQNIRIEREIGRLEKIKHDVEIEQRKLQIEWARLTDPARLTLIGKRKFKLQSAAPQQVIRIRDN